MEFTDLLRVAEINTKYSFFAARSFATNFAHLNIRMGFFDYTEPRVNNNSIQITDVFFGLKTLKHFGERIRTLEIEFKYAESKEINILSKYVDYYCSNTLLELKLGFHDGDILGNFKNSFKHVEKLEFHYNGFFYEEQYQERSIIIPNNMTFPALRSLSLGKLFSKLAQHYENCHFPYLEHLSIGRTSSGDSWKLRDIIRANPQIRSFECVECAIELMHLASTKLI